MPASIFDRTDSSFVRIFREKLRLGETGDGKLIQMLEDSEIDFQKSAKIIFDDDDPTVTSKDAPRGSLYGRTGASGGALYRKVDDGDTTNWSIIVAAADGSSDIKNLGIDSSVAANALTISLKTKAGTDPSPSDKVQLGFRDASAINGTYNVREVTAALSTVISSGSTAGHADATDEFLYVYALDNAGTVELAWSSTVFDEGTLQSTTAEGGAGAADDRFVLYSTTARASVPIRLIGRIKSNQTTAGTWAAAALEESPLPFSTPRAQNIVTAQQIGTLSQALNADLDVVSVTITTNGGPVEVYTSSRDSGNTSSFEIINLSGNTIAQQEIRLRRGVTEIQTFAATYGDVGSGATVKRVKFPATVFHTIDTPAAGTHTYKVQINSDSFADADVSIEAVNIKLIARELT